MVGVLAAAAAMVVLALRADGWVLAYDLGIGGAGLAVTPWLSASSSAVLAVLGTLDRRDRTGGATGGRVRPAVRWPLLAVVVPATVWSVALLPFDVLRAMGLIPLGVSGWGLTLRLLLVTAAAGALVAGGPGTRLEPCPECGRAAPGMLARLPRWPAWLALAFALPYPVLRVVWALGGTFGTAGEPLDMSPAVAWGVVVAGALLVAFTVVLVVDRGPAWLRVPAGFGGAAVGTALAVLGAQASLELWTLVAADGAHSLDGGAGLAWWSFAVVYGAWLVAGLAVVAGSLRYWARRRAGCACREALTSR